MRDRRWSVLFLFLVAAALVQRGPAQESFALQGPARAASPHPAADLGLLATIPWTTDGAEYFDHEKGRPAQADRAELVDAAIARAKAEQKLVLWYVPRVEEKNLQGRQMYRAPVLDVYMQQVVFADADVAAICTECTVPLRCTMDEALSARFDLRPLAFVEPAVVFLDGEGKVVHLVERVRTFHAQWFADLLVRVLDKFEPERSSKLDRDRNLSRNVDLRSRGFWREALAAASQAPEKDVDAWLQIAELQRLLRMPEQALDSLDKAAAAAPAKRRAQFLGDVACERGFLLMALGRTLEAQPLLEQAWRSGGRRAAEAGYWSALNALHLGDEATAMRRFQLVADRHEGSVFGRRARANARLGLDDRPLGAAFTGFESVRYLPDAAYDGLPRDTTWCGAALAPKDLARGAVDFLLHQQRDDGGFSDARYAYWPSSEITPNVWVAISAIAMTALWEYREVFPDLQPRIDAALQRGELFVFDEKRLNRGANEDCYSDCYRLLYLARRSTAADPELRAALIARMNAIVQQAQKSQKPSGFFAHEYENAFCTGAVLQELVAAQKAGATVPDEMTDKAAAALLSARFRGGTFAYGGKAAGERETPRKDSSARMPVCEGALLLAGRSDVDKVRQALAAFWEFMANIEGVRRNDFHSDGELGGFFFFHAVFHASEVVRLLPEAERDAQWQKFVALIQEVPEIDGSFLDSHELGRSYGTAMALLTLRNAVRFE